LKPGGKRQLGITRLRWDGHIRMDLQNVGWGIERIYLAQDRDRWTFFNAAMNLRIL
jgi:hypothetical protein